MMTNFLRKAERFEIEAYSKPKNPADLKKTHLSFSGSPAKHPYDPGKAILIPDPCSGIPSYYEFKKKDISYVEELPNIVTPEGETATLVRIWVKKRSIGVLCSPFLVEETTP
jgi:inorganic pyrophosphatase